MHIGADYVCQTDFVHLGQWHCRRCVRNRQGQKRGVATARTARRGACCHTHRVLREAAGRDVHPSSDEDASAAVYRLRPPARLQLSQSVARPLRLSILHALTLTDGVRDRAGERGGWTRRAKARRHTHRVVQEAAVLDDHSAAADEDACPIAFCLSQPSPPAQPSTRTDSVRVYSAR